MIIKVLQVRTVRVPGTTKYNNELKTTSLGEATQCMAWQMGKDKASTVCRKTNDSSNECLLHNQWRNGKGNDVCLEFKVLMSIYVASVLRFSY